MRHRTSLDTYENLLSNLSDDLTPVIQAQEQEPNESKKKKAKDLNRKWNPDFKDQIQENYGQLIFPCYAIYRAIGVRLDKRELKKYTHGDRKDNNQGRDESKKRGINKYFRCILYYKGDLKQKCAFENNTARRCNLFVQFFENPSDHFNQPPDLTLPERKFWSDENNKWGNLRPLMHSNLRSAVCDVVQNYEYNLVNAPEGVNTLLIPDLKANYPSNEKWQEAFENEMGVLRPPPNEFKTIPDTKTQKRVYRLRPLSNLVTNSGLHLLRIEGAGGKMFPCYKEGKLHSLLQPYWKNYVKELQRACFLSYRAHKLRFDLLNEGDPAKLPQYPPSIRRFRFLDYPSEEKILDTDQPFYPLFSKCNRVDGLLDIVKGMNRFANNNFSYPSVPLHADVQKILNMSKGFNRIQSQVLDEQDYATKPLFQSWVAKERTENSGKRWAQDARQILKQNRYNPDILDIIEQIRDRPVSYGPLQQ